MVFFPVPYLYLSLRVSSRPAGPNFAVEARPTQFSKQSSIILVDTRTCNLEHGNEWHCPIDLVFVNSNFDFRRSPKSSPKFCTAALQTKCQKPPEPNDARQPTSQFSLLLLWEVSFTLCYLLIVAGT